MSIPTRTFSAHIGQHSRGTAGPDQIEFDLDQLFAALDPAIVGIGTENMRLGAVTTPILADQSVTVEKLSPALVEQTGVNAHRTLPVLDHLDNSVTDAKIGTRTLNQGIAAPTGNTALVGTILSWFARQLRAITGNTNWFDTPATTLAVAHTHHNAVSGVHGIEANITETRRRAIIWAMML